MNKNQIEQKVLAVLREKMGCDDGVLAEKYREAPLTWEPFDFTAIQLTYLFLEIERSFGIRIPEHYLTGYGFSTINSIVGVLGEVLTGDI